MPRGLRRPWSWAHCGSPREPGRRCPRPPTKSEHCAPRPRPATPAAWDCASSPNSPWRCAARGHSRLRAPAPREQGARPPQRRRPGGQTGRIQRTVARQPHPPERGHGLRPVRARTGRAADAGARGRIQRPHRRAGPESVQRKVLPARMHDRQRLLHEGRNAGRLAQNGTRHRTPAGRRRSPPMSRWPTASARAAGSCSSRRIRTATPTSMAAEKEAETRGATEISNSWGGSELGSRRQKTNWARSTIRAPSSPPPRATTDTSSWGPEEAPRASPIPGRLATRGRGGRHAPELPAAGGAWLSETVWNGLRRRRRRLQHHLRSAALAAERGGLLGGRLRLKARRRRRLRGRRSLHGRGGVRLDADRGRRNRTSRLGDDRRHERRLADHREHVRAGRRCRQSGGR